MIFGNVALMIVKTDSLSAANWTLKREGYLEVLFLFIQELPACFKLALVLTSSKLGQLHSFNLSDTKINIKRVSVHTETW
jgi:hypothetical protein